MKREKTFLNIVISLSYYFFIFLKNVWLLILLVPLCAFIYEIQKMSFKFKLSPYSLLYPHSFPENKKEGKKRRNILNWGKDPGKQLDLDVWNYSRKTGLMITISMCHNNRDLLQSDLSQWYDMPWKLKQRIPENDCVCRYP